MRSRFRIAFAAIGLAATLALGAGCARFGAEKKAPVETGYTKRSYYSPTAKRTRRYAMYVPPDYNRNSRKYPLILFLHGRGEIGDDTDLLLKHGPVKEGMMRGDFPFLVVAPQCPRPDPSGELPPSRGWVWAEEDAIAVLEDAMKDFRVEPDRIYLTGLSMGGFGVFHLAATRPELWAAAAPICGGGNVAAAGALADIPFRIYHGAKDTVVPPNASVEMHEAILALGGKSELTIYPDADHDSWSKTYSDDDFYAWLLLQRRPEAK